MSSTIKVLIAKVGLDGHDRGAKIVARALADAGMEVIYTGIRQTPEHVVNTAIQEDVDVIGMSTLAGGHNTLFAKVIELLRSKGSNIMVIGGGIVPPDDAIKLKEQGIAEVFGPGTDTRQIIDFIKKARKDSGQNEQRSS